MRPAVKHMLGLVVVVTIGTVVSTFGRRAMERLEDSDSFSLTTDDIARVRQLTVMWSPIESGAPAVYDEHADKLPMSTGEYRRAVRAAEILFERGSLPAGHYEYAGPLADPSAPLVSPFIENRRADVRGNHVAIDVTDAHLKLVRGARFAIIDDGRIGRATGMKASSRVAMLLTPDEVLSRGSELSTRR